MASHYSTYGKEWYRDNRERLADLAKARYLKDPEKHKKRGRDYYRKRRAENPGAYREYWLRQYGLTREKYDDLLRKQQGSCAICSVKLWGLLVVDHDHETGKVRGLLCRECNLGLGNFRDSPDLLLLAVRYLGGHS